jgi:hypothetical protein
MESYEIELERAKRRTAASGRDPADFKFEMSYLPPDADAAGMFTIQYEVYILNTATTKSLSLIGGIGSDWVTSMENALNQGHFD